MELLVLSTILLSTLTLSTVEGVNATSRLLAGSKLGIQLCYQHNSTAIFFQRELNNSLADVTLFKSHLKVIQNFQV